MKSQHLSTFFHMFPWWFSQAHHIQVLVCCGLEAIPGGTGGTAPEAEATATATAVFLAEGCVVCWQSSDAQRSGMWSPLFSAVDVGKI